MKTFIAVLLAFAALSAHAAPPCLSGLYGNQIGNVYVERTAEGWFGHGYCSMPDGSIRPWGFACLHGSCLPAGNFAERISTLVQNPDKTAAQKDWDTNFGNKCATATGALKTVCDAMYLSAREKWPVAATAAPPAPPAAPTYRVKANGLVLTRPAYTLVNGVRGTKEVARAAVGATCDVTKPTLASGADLWAEFGTAGVVALCTKAQ